MSVDPESVDADSLAEANANERWREHLEGCAQCNYDYDCRFCEGGMPGAPDVPRSHACNCPKGGPSNGYHLQQKTTLAREQRERMAEHEALQEAIREAALIITEFVVDALETIANPMEVIAAVIKNLTDVTEAAKEEIAKRSLS